MPSFEAVGSSSERWQWIYLHIDLNSDPATDCNWHYVASDVNGSALPVTIDSGKCIGGSSSIVSPFTFSWTRSLISHMCGLI
jgi:hypothetical protein